MNIYKINETDFRHQYFPTCVCVYQYNNCKYSMAEINTDLYKQSIKIISKIYNTYDELIKSFDINNTIYPVLFNHIIYNDISSTL